MEIQAPPPPARIFEMATAAWLARAVAVAVRRRLFERTQSGLTLSEIGKVLECPERPARMMTDVICGAGLLERRGDRAYPTELACTYLLPDRETYLGDLILMLDSRLYRAWGRLEEAMTLNKPVIDNFQESPLDLAAAFEYTRNTINGLHGMTLMAGKALARAVDFSEVRRVLDLGGGSGAMSIALTSTHPQLEVTAVDHGPIIDVIRDNAQTAGVGDRVHPYHANFFVDPLPVGYDVVILSNILHDWSRAQGDFLLRRAWNALRPGGRVMVSEWLLDDDRNGPLLPALLSLCMLIETDAGENLSGQEIADSMEQRGFLQTERKETLFPHGAIIGHKLSARSASP